MSMKMIVALALLQDVGGLMDRLGKEDGETALDELVRAGRPAAEALEQASRSENVVLAQRARRALDRIAFGPGRRAAERAAARWMEERPCRYDFTAARLGDPVLTRLFPEHQFVTFTLLEHVSPCPGDEAPPVYVLRRFEDPALLTEHALPRILGAFRLRDVEDARELRDALVALGLCRGFGEERIERVAGGWRMSAPLVEPDKGLATKGICELQTDAEGRLTGVRILREK